MKTKCKDLINEMALEPYPSKEKKETMGYGYIRGNKILHIDELSGWVWEDLNDIKKEKPCKRCGHYPTKKGHDYCIANLPGIINACCGHGTQRGYLMFENGKTIIFPEGINVRNTNQ